MSEAQHQHSDRANGQPTVHDPVCGMDIDPADAAGTLEYKGKSYYFCAEYCLNKFKSDPEAFLSADAAAPPTLHGPGVYICPMHPEVSSPTPGACPKCGMALEPRTFTAEEQENPEL